MPKDLITLAQLRQYLDSEKEFIQIADPRCWDTYATVPANSFLLGPFLDWEIDQLGMIDENIIRISIRKGKIK